jgi:hypothetical protein
MQFYRPLQEVLNYALQSNYKVNFVPHHSAWSVHIFHSSFEGIDSDTIYGGTARKKETAFAKAVSEFVERNALLEEFQRSKGIDSTGFAARPLEGISSFTKMRTRWSAILEAMERYYAFHWWEDHSIKHVASIARAGDSPFLVYLDMGDKFSRVFQIQVGTPGLEDVLVLIGMLHDKGFVVGCAAGWAWERHETLFRASAELMRHYHIVRRLRAQNVQLTSVYSQKLLHLASGSLDVALNNRLEKNGSRNCRRPRVLYDGEVKHRFDSLYYVHRYCFEDQPDIVLSNNNIII